MKLRPFILFEKYINTLAFEMASPGNWHCANYIGALSFPIFTSISCQKYNIVHLQSFLNPVVTFCRVWYKRMPPVVVYRVYISN